MEDSKFTEQILNLVELDTLTALNFLQGGDNQYYTSDGIKITVKPDTRPTQYLKDDGSVFFASDIIAQHYRIDKTTENIEKIHDIFYSYYQALEQKRNQIKEKQKEQQKLEEQRRKEEEQRRLEEQRRKLQAEQEQRELEAIERRIQEEQERINAELAKHLQNKQVYPAKERVELNDAATKQLFSLSDNFYKKMLKGTGVLYTERAKTKKKEELQGAFNLSNSNGYDNTTPPSEYDRDILNYLCSEFLKGNRYVTFAMIQRGISGKSGRLDCYNTVSKDQALAIETSLSKLMFTDYRPQRCTNDALKELKYGEIDIKKSAILPACIVRATINGQQVDAVYLDRISPLYQSADIKNQILRYPTDWLDIPNQNNTPLVIALKNYCVRRIAEVIKHKMTPTLTLDDIFDKCRISKASKKVKLDARNTIEKLFAHLQTKAVISSFQWRKKDEKFDAITFSFQPPKAAKTTPQQAS